MLKLLKLRNTGICERMKRFRGKNILVSISKNLPKEPQTDKLLMFDLENKPEVCSNRF